MSGSRTVTTKYFWISIISNMPSARRQRRIVAPALCESPSFEHTPSDQTSAVLRWLGVTPTFVAEDVPPPPIGLLLSAVAALTLFSITVYFFMTWFLFTCMLIVVGICELYQVVWYIRTVRSLSRTFYVQDREATLSSPSFVRSNLTKYLQSEPDLDGFLDALVGRDRLSVAFIRRNSSYHLFSQPDYDQLTSSQQAQVDSIVTLIQKRLVVNKSTRVCMFGSGRVFDCACFLRVTLCMMRVAKSQSNRCTFSLNLSLQSLCPTSQCLPDSEHDSFMTADLAPLYKPFMHYFCITILQKSFRFWARSNHFTVAAGVKHIILGESCRVYVAVRNLKQFSAHAPSAYMCE
jgi:hypothetical protein